MLGGQPQGAEAFLIGLLKTVGRCVQEKPGAAQKALGKAQFALLGFFGPFFDFLEDHDTPCAFRSLPVMISSTDYQEQCQYPFLNFSFS